MPKPGLASLWQSSSVYSTIGVRSAAEELFAQFEKASGHKLAVTWGTAPMLVKRIEGGETADVLVLSRAGIDALEKARQDRAGFRGHAGEFRRRHRRESRRAEARHLHARGAQATLLTAKSIAYSEPSAGGASGVYFAKLLERMGIAEEMKPKTKYPPPGGFSATLLMTGEAELAVQQKPELLHVAGAEVIGLLPGDLNVVTEFAVAIMVGCKNGDAGKALMKMLQSPEASAIFRAKGLDTP